MKKLTTYTSLDEARINATPDTSCIIEIEHVTDGRCYIRARASINVMRAAQHRYPITEILDIIGEHTVETPEQIESALREHCCCERCGKQLAVAGSYHQQEQSRWGIVTAYYCESCRRVLTAVGAGERTAMVDRASADAGYEPHTKSEED